MRVTHPHPSSVPTQKKKRGAFGESDARFRSLVSGGNTAALTLRRAMIDLLPCISVVGLGGAEVSKKDLN